MYIEPNSNIKLYSGIPLDNGYNNTLYFDNISQQNSYFHSNISKYTFARQSYQRVNKGKMRIEIKADLIYDCNYLAFQNTSFGQKWFYCFINSVEYVNDVTSEITFEIDVLQTYLFDITLKHSFVEREHVTDDRIGANLVDEGLNIGNYIRQKRVQREYVNWTVVVWSEYDADSGETASGSIYGGIFQGMHMYIFNIISNGETSSSELNRLNTFLTNVVDNNKQDAIISIQMLPTTFVTTSDKVVNNALPFDSSTFIVDLDGYIPRNKKLFCSPFNMVYCGTADGQSIALQPEYIQSNTRLNVIGTCSPTPEILLYIGYYGGQAQRHDLHMNITGFPHCAFAIDSFRAFCANGGMSQIVLNTASNIANDALAVSQGGSGTVAAVKGALDIGQTALQIAIEKNKPPTMHGVPNGNALSAVHSIATYFVEQRCLNSHYAKIIDDYFTMFGYAINRVKVPNINARPHYTFTKTRNCNAIGKCPSDDLEHIKSIFDNGITFWKNPSEVGNYNVDNRV